MTSLLSRKLQAEKRGKMSPFNKGDPVTLVLRIAYDWQRAAHMRNLRSSPDALARRVQADLKNAEFVWRPTAQDIRWCSNTQDTVEVFWSSRAQSKLQDDLTTTAFGLFEDDMSKLGMNAMVMYQLPGDLRDVARDSFRLWFRFAGKGEPKHVLNRLLFAQEPGELNPNGNPDTGSLSPYLLSPAMTMDLDNALGGSARGSNETHGRRVDRQSHSPDFSSRQLDYASRSPESHRPPTTHRRSLSPPPRRRSPSILLGHTAALTRRSRSPLPGRISTPPSDNGAFFQGARVIAMGYLLDQTQAQTKVLREMLAERERISAEYRARAPALKKELAEAQRVLQAYEDCDGRLRALAQRVGVGDASEGNKLDLIRSFELRLRMLKEKVTLEEKLQHDAEASLERERDRHNLLLAELEQQQFMPNFGMPSIQPVHGVHSMSSMQPMQGPMLGQVGPQFFGHGGPLPSW